MRGSGRAALASLLCSALLSYVAFLYYGLGFARGEVAIRWWHPTRFLLEWPLMESWLERPRLGIAAAALPATLMCVGIFATTRSAWVRALALSCVFTAAAFAAYGIASPMPWLFFHWRWSLILVLGGTAMGWASASPLLAARWIERGLLAGLVLYLPVGLAAAAVIRGATGTDESLPFNFSPWPAFPVLGLEGGAYGVAGILLGLAAGSALLAQGLERPARALAGVACALALPGVWLRLRFGELGPRSWGAVALLSALLLAAIFFTAGAARGATLRRRALHLACGAVLVALPLLAGHALATGDYASNRFYRSGLLIEALERYIEERGSYPVSLEELVEEELLAELPRPRVGFSFVEGLGLAPPRHFHYSEYGSGFNLEFVSTEWIQCTYSASYIHPEDEEELDQDEELGDSDPWTCIEDHPSLWKSAARKEPR